MSPDTRRVLALVGASPWQFAWRDLAWPALGHDEVQIAVEWMGINPSDLQFAQAATAEALPMVLGGEVAGRVTAVGSSVRRVAVGDRVMAYLAQGRAGYACAVRVREVFVVRIAEGLHGALAAASVVAGLTALACLEQAGTVRDRSALVLGAAGGVGSMLVPLLRSRGAQVTATARSAESADHLTAHLGLAPENVMRLDLNGAQALERNLEHPRGSPGFAVVFDLVGGGATGLACRAVADFGTVVGIVDGPADSGSHEALFSRNARFAYVLLYANALRPQPQAWTRYGADLDALAEGLGTGELVPPAVRVVGPCNPATAALGLELIGSGQTRGKLVMQVSEEAAGDGSGGTAAEVCR